MYEFKVKEMTCDHCIKTITSAILSLDPAAEVTAELDKQLLIVHSHLKEKEIIGRIEDAGYRLFEAKEIN